MKPPLVSVIIPTYNRSRLVCEAIDSVLIQTYKNIEIIVVDDGSADNTKLELKKYRNKIKYIYQPNKGLPSARNTGIRASKGTIIAFLDSDDVWLTDKISLQVPKLLESDSIGITTCWSFRKNSKNMEKRSSYSLLNQSWKNQLFEKNILGEYGGPSGVIIKKEVLLKTGLFDEQMLCCEDWDLWMRMSKICEFNSVNECLVVIRVHDSNLSGNFSLMESSCEKVYLKHEEYRNAALLRKARANFYYDYSYAALSKKNIFLFLNAFPKSCINSPLSWRNYKLLIKFALVLIKFYRVIPAKSQLIGRLFE